MLSIDVDQYIHRAPIEAQPILQELRKIILEEVPEVEEKISYSVPFYKYHGELVGYSLAKHHVSFGFGANIVPDQERAQLEKMGYQLGKGTLQIKFHQEVPRDEIRNIIAEKVSRNELKMK